MAFCFDTIQVVDKNVKLSHLIDICFKDACNKKSNQKNIGTIKSSNLCSEILEYSDDKETAVCNLASINLSRTNTKEDFESIIPTAVRCLDNVIDLNFYPKDLRRAMKNS